MAQSVWNLDNLLKHADEITGVVGENLRNEKDFLKRNLFLVSLKKDLSFDLQIDEMFQSNLIRATRFF